MQASRWLARRLHPLLCDLLWRGGGSCSRCGALFRWAAPHWIELGPGISPVAPLCRACAEALGWEREVAWLGAWLLVTRPTRFPLEATVMDVEVLVRLARHYNEQPGAAPPWERRSRDAGRG